MYAKEFEDLLKEYLTDGIITSKERQVLLKKAQELGYDVDEVDLYIDAQQQKCDQTAEAAAAKKRGKICPRCGASVQSLQLSCPECGFEFNSKEANASASELMKKLREAGWARKVTILENYPIPNTKENLAEFISLCIGKCTISLGELYQKEKAEVCFAWRKLSKQVVTKAYIMLKDDPDLMAQAKKLEKVANKKNLLFGESLQIASCILGLLLLFCIFGLPAIIMDYSSSDKNEKMETTTAEPKEESLTDDQIIQNALSDVTKFVNDGKLDDAKDYLTNITFTLSSSYKGLDPAYLKVINAYIKENNYDSAEELALIFRSQIGDDWSWKDTVCYSTLKTKYKSVGRDFSILKSKYEGMT